MRDRTGQDTRLRAPHRQTVLVGAAALALVVAAGLVAAGGWLPGGPPGEHAVAATADDPRDAASTDASRTPRETPRSSGADGPANATTIAGEGMDELGYSVAVGDANGDGVPDLLLGAPLRNATGTESGAAFLFYGPVDAENLTTADADVTFPGEEEWNWAGNSVLLADVDGDGTDDAVIGAPLNGAAGPAAGAVYVLFGGNLSGTIPLTEADARLVGESAESFAGYSVDAADLLDGPGADLVVGAPRTNASGAESGAVYLVSGAELPSNASLATADATFVGADAGDQAGHSVAAAGDVDGDGTGDVVIGARRSDAAGTNAGAAYVLLGEFDGRRSLADAAVALEGAAAGDHAGTAVAGGGDVNGDGYADVLVGAPFADAGGDDAGAAYVVYGGPDLPERATLPAAGATFVGAASGDRAGASVAGAGDATCDGRDDVLVGAPGDATGGEDAGAAYLVGDAAAANETASLAGADLALAGADPGDRVGRAERLAAFRADGVVGLVVGAPFGDPGTVHVISRECPDAGP